DDNFIREVNEEYRQDQAKALFDKYGFVAIGVAIVVILAAAGWRGYDYWQSKQAAASGDAFAAALNLVDQGKTDEAIKALDDLEKSGHGAYPILARMRVATALADKGDYKGAVAGLDAVAGDKSVAQSIRDIANLRAAYLLVDHGSYADVAKHAESLTDETNPLRFSAREALGLAAWKDGKPADALKLFEGIAGDATAPADARQRANMMTGLIRGSGDAK
ncbi:MAG: tetratricopeptide repeat protein, partial [Rhizobiaceae bacterium]